jgi:hypothetical protein
MMRVVEGAPGRPLRLGRCSAIYCLLLAFLTVTGACGPLQVSQRPGAVRSPGVHSSSPAPTPGSLAEWQARGATEVPPSSIRSVSLAGIEVVNATGGAVSDADARSWAEAFVRADRYEVWAMNAMQDAFLRGANLSKQPDTIFAPDFGHIAEARSQNKRIRDTGLAYHRMILRAVPQSLTPTFTAQGFGWSPYAFFIDFGGPFELSYYGPDGQSETKDKLDPGLRWPQLMSGEYDTSDSLMGPLWVLTSDWSCIPAYNQQVLGGLCSGA